MAELQPDESNLDSVFLDTLTQNSPETWRMKLKLANQTLEFKIDTGAEVTAISDVAFRAFKGLKLDRPKKMLYGPARTLLKVIGQFEGELFYRGKTTKQNVYVVNGLRTNLLGLPAILALKLVAKLEETVETSLHTIVKNILHYSRGWGAWVTLMTFSCNQRHSPMHCLPPRTFLYHCISRSSRSWSEWSH